MPVPIDHAGANFIRKCFPALLTVRQQSRCETKPSIIGLADRGGKVVDADHLQQRPKYFFVQTLVDRSDIDDARRKKCPA